MTASKLQPALIGGVVLGLLSGIPVVNIGNCCCCLWVIGGGALAVYLLQQKQAAPVDLADAAMVGLMAGVIGAVVSSLVALPFSMMVGAMNTSAGLDEAINRPNMPEQVRTILERMRDMGAGQRGGVATAFGFILSLFVDAIFGAIGGVLGGVMFKKKLAATVPPPPPPFTV